MVVSVSDTVDDVTRCLPLSGCFNFRDLGGYVTNDGRRVVWRRLFRADGLGRLDEDDCRLLAGLGLASVIDLRTANEVEQRGRLPEGAGPVQYHHLPLYDVLPPDREIERYAEPEFVTSRYRQMFTEGRSALVTAIETLAQPGALPAVFHCSAGKDRTGVLAALVLGFLGVPVTIIAEDYSLSGESMVAMLAWMRQDNPDRDERLEQLAPAIISAPARSMVAFLEGLLEQHGDFDTLAAHLGVTAAVTALRSELLA